MKRGSFIKHAGLLAAGSSLFPGLLQQQHTIQNSLPRWRGFNVLDFFTPDPTQKFQTTTKQHFQWMQDWGFDFVRIPIAYPYYLQFDRSRNITPEEVYQFNSKATDEILTLVHAAHQHQLHVSLNLHRAPGYCINAGFHEPYNLWKDETAQHAFYHHWNFWARQFKNTSN